MTDDQDHRIFGKFKGPESAAIWLIIVLLGFFAVWAFVDGEADSGPPLRAPFVNLVKTDKLGQVAVSVELNAMAYVAVFCQEAEEQPRQLFPRLGPPRNMDWPLKPKIAYVLPNPKEHFRLSPKRTSKIFVMAHKTNTPILPHLLWASDSKDDIYEGLKFQVIHYDPLETKK
jgi:hypothetical protein